MKDKQTFRMRKAYFGIFLLVSSCCSVLAQDTAGFKPSGSPILVLFSDYTAGLGENKEATGFNLTRARMGYQYQATPSLSFTGALDMNSNGDRRTINFHYAFLEWKYQNLAIDAGLIALAQFSQQEAFWGRRYIEKSFQDLNGLALDSDIGLMLKYRFTDWLEIDAAVFNGEGDLQLNASKTNRYGLGATIRPFKGLMLRAYLDTYDNYGYVPPADMSFTSTKNQSSMAFFAGYRHDKFSFGAEYNRQTAKMFISGVNYSGVSVYSSVSLTKKFEWFARYDYVDTEGTADLDTYWSAIVNKTLLISGFEYHPIKYIQLSPNYRYEKSVLGNDAHFICLNLGFSL
ncbi:hypothetical protein EZS27_019933 [termite gut metagenome]|uniref:Porin n=1 Tax=termite gut metagenome TaxID=433724 RepID=A0A5J4RBL3_9ZZZZ